MKKSWKVSFVSGLSVKLNLTQWELKQLIHKYKVSGYEKI